MIVSTQLVPAHHDDRGDLTRLVAPPGLVSRAGRAAVYAYEEFFGAMLENEHTLRAYRNAVDRFLRRCDAEGLALSEISPAVVAAHIQSLTLENGDEASVPTKKLHLAAIRHFFDLAVMRHAVLLNPATSVRGPRLRQTEGKTPAVSSADARRVLNAVDISTVVGLRDRAVIGILIFTAARGGAVARLRLRDYGYDTSQHMLTFREKGGRLRKIPVRHDLQNFLDEYVAAADLRDAEPKRPMFRTAIGRTGALTERSMTGGDVYRMVKRRFKESRLPDNLTCHTFRATTITDLLDQKLPLEDVQHLAGHADPRTTKLYHRSDRQVTRNLVERISI